MILDCNFGFEIVLRGFDILGFIVRGFVVLGFVFLGFVVLGLVVLGSKNPRIFHPNSKAGRSFRI